ncbi:MAG: hypothetical protein CEN91_212, partial [Candidatus Berkelbacteria bacterium Licking1014_85]
MSENENTSQGIGARILPKVRERLDSLVTDQRGTVFGKPEETVVIDEDRIKSRLEAIKRDSALDESTEKTPVSPEITDISEDEEIQQLLQQIKEVDERDKQLYGKKDILEGSRELHSLRENFIEKVTQWLTKKLDSTKEEDEVALYTRQVEDWLSQLNLREELRDTIIERAIKKVAKSAEAIEGEPSVDSASTDSSTSVVEAESPQTTFEQLRDEFNNRYSDYLARLESLKGHEMDSAASAKVQAELAQKLAELREIARRLKGKYPNRLADGSPQPEHIEAVESGNFISLSEPISQTREKELKEGEGPRNIEELVSLIQNLSFAELRDKELVKKYGEGTLAKIKMFLAGERDFELSEEGNFKRNCSNELARKGLSIFANRRTLASGSAMAVLGLLTGGVGFAASGVLFGSIAGRAVAELFGGDERTARKEVLIAERERWRDLKELANQIPQITDPTEKARKMTELVDIYYKQGEEPILEKLKLANERFADEKQSLNKLRGRLQTVGEIVGGAAGIAHGFLAGRFSAIDIDLWNKIPNQQIAHNVSQINGVWSYATANSEPLTREISKYVVQDGKIWTALGEPTWKIAAATLGERTLPVFLAALSAGILGKKAEDNREKKLS